MQDQILIIAELSANHGHDLKNAIDTVKAAADSGANAIKIQTYTADTITLDCDNDYFKVKQGTIWDGKTLYQLYKEAYTPWKWHESIKEEAEKQGLVFFSTPFDLTAVDFLENLKVPLYKIASFEITDVPLIKYVASKQKPMLISTGVASLQDIQDAVEACHSVGNHDITLLKCTSSYPAPIDDANLLTMVNLGETFQTKIGLSDHTLGQSVAAAAAALGAKIIEKHFIIDRNIGGPDASFSMIPSEFKLMVKTVREVEKALGSVTYEMTEKKKKNREFCRSLFVVKDVKAGEVVTKENVRSVRPGFGMPPKYFDECLGKIFLEDVKAGEPFSLTLVSSTFNWPDL